MYVEEVIDTSDATSLAALNSATQQMLCNRAILCDVAPHETSGQNLRRLSEAGEVLLRNDTVVGFAAHRQRSAQVVLSASDNLRALLRQALLNTSLAPHASRVHLGPSHYLQLFARVTVVGPVDPRSGSARPELLMALSDAASLEAALARGLNVTNGTLVALQISPPEVTVSLPSPSVSESPPSALLPPPSPFMPSWVTTGTVLVV